MSKKTKVTEPTTTEPLSTEQQLQQLLEKMAAEGGTPTEVQRLVKKVMPVERKVNPNKRKLAPDTVDAFIKWFAQAPEEELYDVKRSQWQCVVGNAKKGTAHRLIFNSALLKDDPDHEKKGAHIIMLRGTSGVRVPIFNASAIAYGTSIGRAQKHPQAIAEACGAVPVPFDTVIQDAKLDLAKLEVVDWSGSEHLYIPPVGSTQPFNIEGYSYWGDDNWGPVDIVRRHFAGAVLLRVAGTYFLFDADRNEVKYHFFNPFFTQLPGPAQTIKEAYELLAPEFVRYARDTAPDTDIQRQGEFFFVKVSDAFVEDIIRNNAPKVPKAYTDMTYPHIINMAERFSARDYNMYLVRIHRAVTNWMTNRFDAKGHIKIAGNGSVATTYYSAEESIADPKQVTKALFAWLESPAAVPDTDAQARLRAILDKRTKYGPSYYYSSHRDLSEWSKEDHDELVVRLNPDRGLDKAYKILLDQNLTVANGLTDGRTNRQNGHKITLTVQDPNDPKVWYARGHVEHSGRQHHSLWLKGWYRVCPNTAVANYTVHGDCD
jgi:hypothetical protein